MEKNLLAEKSNTLIKRSWIYQKIAHCIATRGTARTCGVLILGGSGSGKSTVCRRIIEDGEAQLKRALLAHHTCSSLDYSSLCVTGFILGLHTQILASTRFKTAYTHYLTQSSSWELLTPAAVTRNPEKAFKNGVLLALLSFEAPASPMFMLVDSVDDGFVAGAHSEGSPARLEARPASIVELLAAQHNFIPDWLSLVATCKRDSVAALRRFPGFRRLLIDDVGKPALIRDIHMYILTRVDADHTLKKAMSRQPDLVNILHVKSNGHILYLEVLLDLVVTRTLPLSALTAVPGTIPGLYLFVFESIFPESEELALVKHIFSVILASPLKLTPQQLYNALLHYNPQLDFYHVKATLHKLRYFLNKHADHNTLTIKHVSLAEWLIDVKMCTTKYKCSLTDGHALLSLYYTHNPSLCVSQPQILCFLLHIFCACPIFQLRPHHIIAWLLYTDCDLTKATSDPHHSLPDPILQQFVSILLAVFTPPHPQREAYAKFSHLITSINKFYLKRKTTSVFNDAVSLHDAVRKNNYDYTNQLISQGVCVGKMNSNGTTPLMIAAQNGCTDICELLLTNGAEKDVLDKDDWTPLRLAIWSGHKDVVKLLLTEKSSPDFAGKDNRTALRTAAWVGDLEIAHLLLEHGAQINKPDSEGRTPLMAATYRGHTEMVKYLLKKGADVDHTDNDGRNALFVSVLCLNIPPPNVDSCQQTTTNNTKSVSLVIVELLLLYSSNVNQVDLDGMTPLSIAAYEGNKDLCELLLDSGADIDFIDRNSRTPLMAATLAGHYEVVQVLLFWGSAIHCLDKNGWSVLSICAGHHGHPGIMQELLDRGLDEMHRDNRGHTPLHIAALEGHLQAVKLLLQAGARPSETDDLGRIPLTLACQEGHCDIVELLLDVWRDSIDFVSLDGSVPLKVALLNEWRDVVLILLDRSANVNLLDNNGRSALHIAVLQQNYDCFSDLLLYIKNYRPGLLDLQEENGRSALHLACWKGDVEMVMGLLQAGLKTNVKDNEGRSPLHLAAWQGHLDACRLLLRYEARIDECCNQGATSLCVAAQEGHLDICDLLIKSGANIYHADDFKRTPYKVAYKSGHTKICKLLERHGALIFMNK